jgi:CRISPR-associated endonuclease/helicase Cas3
VLFAKSAPRLTLIQHTRDVVECAEALFGLGSRWGEAWLRFFMVPASQHEQFLLNLRVACWLHDLGKANAEFQAAVQSESRQRQSLRHEHLSALWIMTPALRGWLSSNPVLDVDAICASVLSHHIKASALGDHSWGQLSASPRVEVLGAHPDVQYILAQIAQIAHITAPLPTLLSHDYSLSDDDWTALLDDALLAAQRFERRLSDERRRMTLALKLGLMVADAGGSGLRRTKRPIAQWVEEVIHEPLTPQEVSALIARKEEDIRHKRRGFTPHRFQTGAATLGDRALLLAGCGAGKTLAAWYWLRSVVERRPGKIGRLLFLYPTRGTATEGFRDYVAWAPPEESALLHGTAEWDLERMAQNPQGTHDAASAQGTQLDQDMQRLFALGHWPRRYFSATVDQFLSALEHHYGAICRWPLLADAAVVIDEVHSFDRHMFEDLISFLKHFDVPVLCMTATLSSDRRGQLEGCGLEVYPRAADRALLEDLERAETQPRYRVRCGTLEEARARVDSMRSGRVLWVMNTVDACQREAKRLEQVFGERAFIHCYHSRFKLEDRGTHHREVVDAFSNKETTVASDAAERLVIAVTTQVCEMSLDLDADVLITALAPPSSLVQRMGRANRAGSNPALGEVWVFEPERALPYEAEALEATRQMLAQLHVTARGFQTLDQRSLAEVLERVELRGPRADGSSRLVRAGFYATPGDFRDSDAFTTPCILSGDVSAVRAALAAKATIDRWVVPVPRDLALPALNVPGWPSWLGVADSAHYTQRYGFERPQRDEEG